MRKENTIESILLRELKKASQSQSHIAEQIGVSQSALSRFTSGDRGLSVWAAAQLLDFFGYKIVKGKGTKA